MSIVIGSARADERYKYSGGRRGDQRQKSSYDTTGEVSLQSFYVPGKGWDVIRPKKKKHADAIAKAQGDACKNKHFGYSQSDRYSIFNYKDVKNANIENNVNCDCSSLVRKSILDGTGVDVGDFNTANEASVLEKSGLFEEKKKYTNGMTLYDGDILVTCTKGHTAIVVSGNPRTKGTSGSTEPVKQTYCIGNKYTVKASGLNMRTAPGTSNDIITKLKTGDKITCKQIKHIGKSTWISNGAGWACAISDSGKVYIG